MKHCEDSAPDGERMAQTHRRNDPLVIAFQLSWQEHQASVPDVHCRYRVPIKRIQAYVMQGGIGRASGPWLACAYCVQSSPASTRSLPLYLVAG